MHSKTLFTYLRSLTKEEWKLLAAEVKASCKPKSKAYAIFKTINKQPELLYDKEIDLQTFGKMVLGNSFKETDYYNHAKKIEECCIRVLLKLRLEKAAYVNTDLLLFEEQYTRPALWDEYTKTIAKLYEMLQEANFGLPETYLIFYRYFYQAYFSVGLELPQYERENLLHNALYFLDCFHLAEKTKIHFELLLDRHLIKRQGNSLTASPDALHAQLSSLTKKKIPPLNISMKHSLFLIFIRLLELEQPGWNLATLSDHFSFFKKIEPQLPLYYRTDIIHILILYCTKEMNTGQYEFVPFAYELLDYSIRNKYAMENGLLQKNDFLDYINLCYRVKGKENANKNIEVLKEYLVEDIQEGVVNMAFCSIAFQEKEYDKASQLLAYCYPKSIQDRIRLRLIEIRIAYIKALKSAHSDTYFLAHDRFRKWLETESKDDLSVSRKQVYKEFASVLRRLLSLQLQKKELHSFKNEISQQPLLLKPWILEVIKETEGQ